MSVTAKHTLVNCQPVSIMTHFIISSMQGLAVGFRAAKDAENRKLDVNATYLYHSTWITTRGNPLCLVEEKSEILASECI